MCIPYDLLHKGKVFALDSSYKRRRQSALADINMRSSNDDATVLPSSAEI